MDTSTRTGAGRALVGLAVFVFALGGMSLEADSPRAGALPAGVPPAAAPPESDLDAEPLFRAMKDELVRGMARLRLEDLERPFYLEYTVRDTESASAAASFGALTSRRHGRGRRLSVDLRVGDYVFDNTNFRGSGGTASRRLPLDDDYDSIRHAIWLATDSAYKSAIEAIARKRAIVKQMNVGERPDDFQRMDPLEHLGEPVVFGADREAWEGAVRRLSKVFQEYPGVQSSWVSWNQSVMNQVFLTSEGSRNRWGRGSSSLTAFASMQAKDGMRLSDRFTVRALHGRGLPGIEDLTTRIRKLCEDLVARAGSESPEDYTGPVLFEGEAAARFLNSLFVSNVENPRLPLFASEGSARSYSVGMLARKFGLRVLPKEFSVYDAPTLAEWEGTPLFGTYPVDDEGVPPQRVDLVKKGKLKDLLMSRAPTEKVTGSNGHGRGVGRSVGRAANVVFSSSDAQSEEALREAFLEMCRDEGLDYGIVVRKLSGRQGGIGRPIAWKVYVEDGREEPTRGLGFQRVNVSALRDIEAAGETKHVYHTGSGSSASSIVAPSLLIGEMDLRKPPPQRAKLPYMDRPEFE